MKFPFFASFIVFIIWLRYEIKKTRKKDYQGMKDFWQKESDANSVRRKSLDNLDYIQIPYDSLPYNLLPEHEDIKAATNAINALKDSKIVNLTGITNTELKMTYGAPNINLLSEYDQNYTILSSSIYKWGAALFENGYQKEGVSLLEFGIATGTDISGNYRILYYYYKEHNMPEQIEYLRMQAGRLNSTVKTSIIRLLSEDGHID